MPCHTYLKSWTCPSYYQSKIVEYKRWSFSGVWFGSKLSNLINETSKYQKREIFQPISESICYCFFFYATHLLDPVYISTQYHQNIYRIIGVWSPQGLWPIVRTVYNRKYKEARVVFLLVDTSAWPSQHFYQVSSKYINEHRSYGAKTS